MTNENSSIRSPLSPQTLSKPCSSCGIDQPVSEFHRRKDRPDGRQTSCKSCHKERQRTWARPADETMGEIQLTDAQKREIYSGAILRMYNMGLVSKATSKEVLERILKK